MDALLAAGCEHPLRAAPRPVTVWRRWFGMLLDWLGLGVLRTAATVAWAMLVHVTGW